MTLAYKDMGLCIGLLYNIICTPKTKPQKSLVYLNRVVFKFLFRAIPWKWLLKKFQKKLGIVLMLISGMNILQPWKCFLLFLSKVTKL